MKSRSIVVATAVLLLSSIAQAAEVRLLASGALKDAYLELLPDFEKVSGHRVTAAWSSTTDIQKRVMAGEVADLVILGSAGTEELLKQAKLVGNTLALFAKSGIYVAVRSGAAIPDMRWCPDFLHFRGGCRSRPDRPISQLASSRKLKAILPEPPSLARPTWRAIGGGVEMAAILLVNQSEHAAVADVTPILSPRGVVASRPPAPAPDLLQPGEHLGLHLVGLVEARAGDLVGRDLLRREVAGVVVRAVVAATAELASGSRRRRRRRRARGRGAARRRSRASAALDFGASAR